MKLSTTEDTEDTEKYLVSLCVLRVLRGGELMSQRTVIF